MSDLISRQEVLNLFDRDSAGKYWGKINNDLLHEIWCDINNLPSAERKKGKWERHYSRPNVYADLCWHCSICEFKTLDNWANKWNFCPNCGADMRGEE